MKKYIYLTGWLIYIIFQIPLVAQPVLNTNTANNNMSKGISVMPYPEKVETGSNKLRITSSFTICLLGDENDRILQFAVNRLIKRLNSRTLAYFEQENVMINRQVENAILEIKVNKKSESLPGTDESYQLSIDSVGALLTANNTIGALRGIETILQLVGTDGEGYFFPEVKIEDSPRFKWRGMMVDAARHFIPVDVLKRNIDAMAMVKLNVLHMHLSDDEGFRVESKIFPKLQEFGSNGQYYTQCQLKDLINYASERGIMIYPEFDLPGHCTSWLAGYPEFASAPGPYKTGHRFSIEQGTPMVNAVKIIMQSATPTFNPTSEEAYRFLDKFVAEMSAIFPSPYMHIGADENNGMAWKNNLQIVQFMKSKGMKDVNELQAYFVKRMYSILKKHNRTTIGWEELYDSNLPKDVVVQVWGAMGANRALPMEIAEKGNPVLISKGFYLDYFYPAYIHYLNPNIPSTINFDLFGGEAALWSELVDENSFEGRAWPRTAAIAERLWSPENVNDVNDMYRRLFILSDRLEESGLNHRLNSERMLVSFFNDKNIQMPLLLFQTLAPSRGVRRLMAQFTALPRTKFQSVPLVDLIDLASTDSKEAWQFRKLVETYLAAKDTTTKAEIITQLKTWNEAALNVISKAKSAPNLAKIAIYAARVAQATEIGLQMLDQQMEEPSKSAIYNTVKNLKSKDDEFEILILPEIQALVNGILEPLPMTFSPF